MSGRAAEIATERLIAAVEDPDRYPDGTAFIPADAPDFQAMFARHVAEHRPVAIVYPDGREVLATPAAGSAALLLTAVIDWLARLGRRKRASVHRHPPDASIRLPADYRIEFREKVAAG